MATRLLLTITAFLLAPLTTLAQAGPDPIVIPSDTDTEWFNEDTSAYEPAAITIPHHSWPPLSGSHWIWNIPQADHIQRREGAIIEFRRTFELPEARTGTLYLTADNEVTASLNGEEVANTACDFSDADECILPFLIQGIAGENELSFTVENYSKPGATSTQNPAGFIYQATFDEVISKDPDPIVIVPGMLVSVSPLTTFLDIPSNFWTFTLGARGYYTSLIQQLELSGLLENEHVFVAHYDWRKPVADNVNTYLKPAIEQAKQQNNSNQVDIVAHSMGGLLARTYIQSDDYESDVDQLITLGTPHQGAADAYVAWEGGFLPETWSTAIRGYILAIETALNTRHSPDLPRPKSFRTFFASLKDLLPITNYITQDGADVPINSLTEQNNFLNQLHTDIVKLEARGIDVAAIVGTDVQTLGSINLQDSRTPEDEALQRWRDGRPVAEPITPNTLAGDQRVLLSSATIGTNIFTFPGGNHDALPHTAREKVLEILDIEPEPFVYEPPDITSLLGITILSPIDPVITCGNQVLSENQNSFPEAQYIADPNSPNAPKLLAIGNPPEGECEVTLTGTGTGEYDIVTCFADKDEEVCTTREGTTETGKVETYAVNITPGSFNPPTDDVVTFVCQIPDTVKTLLQQGRIALDADYLHGQSTSFCQHTQKWQTELAKRGPDAKQTQHWHTQSRESSLDFIRRLAQAVEDGQLDEEAMRQLVPIRDQLIEVLK